MYKGEHFMAQVDQRTILILPHSRESHADLGAELNSIGAVIDRTISVVSPDLSK